MLEYIEMDENGIDQIKFLWEKLNEHHKNKTAHFLEYFSNNSFEQRKNTILQQSKFEKIRVEIVRDSELNNFIGYCVSSVDLQQNGEIVSLFVEASHRTSGIGATLMEHAINWMENLGVHSKHIVVTYGNEEVLSFYEKFGFYPRILKLEQK